MRKLISCFEEIAQGYGKVAECEDRLMYICYVKPFDSIMRGLYKMRRKYYYFKAWRKYGRSKYL